MIQNEIINGLLHTFSDSGMWLRQKETGREYIETWDVIPNVYTYEEIPPLVMRPPISETDLELAKAEKIEKIKAYNTSDAVNTFFVNDVPAWLTPGVRTNYKASVEAAELLGEKYVIVTITGYSFELMTPEAKLMLAKIQRYADKCENTTQIHIDSVMKLENQFEIDNYDFTIGYPQKELFYVTNY